MLRKLNDDPERTGTVRPSAKYARRALLVTLLGLGPLACGDDPPLEESSRSDGATRDRDLPEISGGGTAGTSSDDSNGDGATAGSGGTAATADVEITADMMAVQGEAGIFEGATAAHNAIRNRLDLPPLRWSSEIASHAQQWSDALAENCGSIGHRPDGRYGENVALRWSRPLRTAFSAEQAVQGWADEADCWTYGTISGPGGGGTEICEAQCVARLSSSGCGHYTQVVWQDTEHVGCGYSTCNDGEATIEIWVCNYDPPGNFVGQTPY